MMVHMKEIQKVSLMVIMKVMKTVERKVYLRDNYSVKMRVTQTVSQSEKMTEVQLGLKMV